MTPTGSFTLRNTDEATWDEQGCTPSRTAVAPPVTRSGWALWDTLGDTAEPGDFTGLRVSA